MSTSQHIVKHGETLEDISRQFYGDESLASMLAEANDISVVEVLQEGRSLIIPLTPLRYTSLVEQTPYEVTVEITPRLSQYVRVPVRELVFPGTAADNIAVQGKWIYAIADGQIALSVSTERPDYWLCRRRNTPGPEIVTDGRLMLERAKSYRVFLSPIELTPATEQRLIDKLADCKWLTTVDQPATVTVSEPVLLRDPFQWAADLHDRDYLPKLEEWQRWLADDKRASRRLVASAFLSIIEQGDVVDIEDSLRDGEPRKDLKKDADAEKSQRAPAERAAHYLASWIDCEDHRIIEAAHVERGPDPIELVIVHWACVLGDLNQVFEGRQLLDVVASDAQLVPRRFVITDQPELELDFGVKRYLSLAARALVQSIGPAALQYLYPNNPPGAREAVARYYARFGEATPLMGTYRQIRKNLKDGRKLSHKVKSRKSLDKLVQKAKQAWQDDYQARLPRTLVMSERLAQAYERNLGKLDKTALFSLETMNLAIAIQELIGAESGDKLAKAVGAVGASADAGLMLLEVREILKGTTKRAVSGVLGVISGTCDMVAFVSAARRAGQNYDVNQAFGQGIAAVGAGGVIVGSGIALASLGAATAAEAASLVALGAWVGGVGAVVIGAGALWASLATDSAYQQLGMFSFLGPESEASPRSFDWSPVELPAASNPEREAVALFTLVSAFEMELKDKEILMITPHFYRAGDVLEIYYEGNYGATSPNACFIEVDLEIGETVQTKGIRPLQPSVTPTFNSQGVLTSLRIDLLEIPDGHTLWFKTDLKVQARMKLAYPGAKTFYSPAVPHKKDSTTQPWVEVAWTAWGGSGKASSTDDSKYINRIEHPVNGAMKALHG